jgi:plastocyanin
MSNHEDQSKGGLGFPLGGRRAALLITCAALATGGVMAGCGDDQEPATTGSTSVESTTEAGDTGGGESVDQIEIAEFLYEPEAVTVDAGTEITWTNADVAPHTATADDSSFDTGTLDKGDSASQTFDEPGTYTYYCRFHAFMNGTVEVR